MKYKVIKRFKRLSENLKEYNFGDDVTLNKKDAAVYLESKLVVSEEDFIEKAKKVEADKSAFQDRLKKNKQAPITKKGSLEKK